MRILFLTNNKNTEPLINWLRNSAGEDVIVWGEKITKEVLEKLKPNFLISYNYNYLIKKEILDSLPHKVINLHISLLPYNRGANPNVWSFLDNTPKGVTIHLVDEGLDTGDILLQKEVSFDEQSETLASSYNKLHEVIQHLLKKNWDRIKTTTISPQPQIGIGTAHSIKDFKKVENILGKEGWDININDLKQRFNKLLGETS